MQNIELKVRVPDLNVLGKRLRELGAVYQWAGRQTDTYFRVPGGRLKLRETDSEAGATLIGYRRPDQGPSRVSQYHLSAVDNVEAARRMLSDALGVLATVDKRRSLYRYGTTRIHLDEVDRLGSFVELETVVQGAAWDTARDEHAHVVAALGLDRYEVVAVSYSDLVLDRSEA